MVVFVGDIILPHDQRWIIPNSEQLVFTGAALAGPDAFVVSAQLEGELYTLADAYSRFYRYDAGRWLCAEVDLHITDLLILDQPSLADERLLVLSEEGEVWFVGKEARTEQVPKPLAKSFSGGLTMLSRQGSAIVAAGLGGQCCRRQDGGWERDDMGVLNVDPPYPRKRPGDVGQSMDIKDIATLPNGDQYICGSIATARPGLFWRPIGTRAWQWLGSGMDDPAYDYMVFNRMFVEAPDKVWISTNIGVLFKGNATRGFRIATDTARWTVPDRSMERFVRFGRIVSYRGSIHVSSNVGPFRLAKDGAWQEMPPLPPIDGAPPGKPRKAGGRLEVAGDVLWSIGTANTGRYDGQAWTRIVMPPIYQP